MIRFRRWVFRQLLVRVAQTRDSDFVIGPPDTPYMRRWWVIPRNHYFNIYLHQILADDNDEALHDHPWWNMSWLLSGRYVEWMPKPPHWTTERPLPFVREEGEIVFRRAIAAHRLQLFSERVDGKLTFRREPCWTLFVTGPLIREWGFYCPNGWRHWRLFTEEGKKGQRGIGCGEQP